VRLEVLTTVFMKIEVLLDVFADFLNEKKKLVHGSDLHLSFNHPLHTRQTDSVMSDVGKSDE